MPPDLKDRLQNAADLNGRSLNMEVVHRLTVSLEARTYAGTEPMRTESPVTEYTVLSDTDNKMLSVFRRLPPDKQLALITLFK